MIFLWGILSLLLYLRLLSILSWVLFWSYYLQRLYLADLLSNFPATGICNYKFVHLTKGTNLLLCVFVLVDEIMFLEEQKNNLFEPCFVIYVLILI